MFNSRCILSLDSHEVIVLLNIVLISVCVGRQIVNRGGSIKEIELSQLSSAKPAKV